MTWGCLKAGSKRFLKARFCVNPINAGEDMHQFRVELRIDLGRPKFVDVMADSHEQAYARAQRQQCLTVLSTELIA